MKKKTIVIIAAIAVAVIGAIVALILILSPKGGNISKNYRDMKEAMNEVVSSTLNVAIYDGETEISGSTMTCEIKDGSLVKGIARTQLNSDFELETELPTYTTYSEFNRENLLYVYFSEDLISSYSKKKNVVTCKVSKENLGKVLLISAPESGLGDAAIEFTLENKKVYDISVKYTTESGKRVVVTISYKY